MTTFTPDLAPIGGSLAWSSLIAILPLATVFVTLGVLKWKAHYATLAGLAVAILVAVLGYHMPVALTGLSAVQGFIFGLFPIMWIVVNAIWFHEITVRSGRFDDLGRVINAVSDDPRVQAILIAFSFSALLESLAGFGAPVAITAAMMLAVGFRGLKAAMIILVANTVPVVFGAVSIPIFTAASLTSIEPQVLSAAIGRQVPFIAIFVPLLVVILTDGKRGLRQTWPVALVAGLSYAVAQWASATWLSVELTGIIAALVSMGAVIAMLKVWKPQGAEEAHAQLIGERDTWEAKQAADGLDSPVAVKVATAEDDAPLTASRTFWALFPYLTVIVVFCLAKLVKPIAAALDSVTLKFGWPGLDGHVNNAAGEQSTMTVFKFDWLASPGTLLLLTGFLVAAVLKVKMSEAVKAYGQNLYKSRFSILTVASTLSLAYVMNLSGQTITIGTWIAGAGAVFAFLSPLLGWIGTAVTGSDTSAGALFATLQQTAAHNAGLDPTWLVAANSSGGIMGKMICPQSLSIAATALAMKNGESEILRKVIPWSCGMIAVLCLIVGIQSVLFF